VLSLSKCNPNLFGHFFYPCISLNLDDYDIPLSSCFSIYFMHPSILMLSLLHLILFFVLFLSMCLFHSIPFFILLLLVCFLHLIPFSFLFLSMCFIYDSILYLIFVYVSCPSHCELTTTCDFMVTGSNHY